MIRKLQRIKMEVERTGNYQMKDVNNVVFLSIHPPPSYSHIVLANETDSRKRSVLDVKVRNWRYRPFFPSILPLHIAI